MYTATIEKILGPIAESIGTMYVIYYETDRQKKPMPDLKEAAYLVHNSIITLLNVSQQSTASLSKQLSDGGEEEEEEEKNANRLIAANMKNACEQLQHADSQLTQSAYNLKEDPFSSLGKKELVESCRGILEGTRKVLETFDDIQLKHLMYAIKVARKNIQLIMTIEHMEDFSASIVPATQTFDAIGLLTDQRLKELVVEEYQARLKMVSRRLRRYSALFFSAEKNHLTNSKNMLNRSFVTKQRNMFADELYGILTEMEKILSSRVLTETNPTATLIDDKYVLISFDKIIEAYEKQLNQIHGVLLDQIHEISKPAIENFLLATQTMLSNHVKFAQEFKLDEAREKSEGQKSLLNNQCVALGVLVDHSSHGKLDIRKKKELTNLSLEIDQNFRDIVQNVIRTAFQRIEYSFLWLDREMSRQLVAAIKIRDHNLDEETRWENVITNTQTSLRKLHRAIGYTAMLFVKDATLSPAIRALSYDLKSLQSLLNHLNTSSQHAFFNDKSVDASDHFDLTLQTWRDHLADLRLAIDNAFDPNKLLIGSTFQIKEALNDLLAIISRAADISKVKQEKNIIDEKLKRMVLLLKQRITATNDEKEKARILSAFAEFDHAQKHFESQFASYETNPNSITRKETEDALREMIFKMSVLEGLLLEYSFQMIRNQALEDQFAQLNLVSANQVVEETEHDVIYVHETAPQLLSEAEAKENPIKAAAQKLRVEASKWDTKNNLILSTIEQIAEQFLLISNHYKLLDADSKKMLISASQQISTLSNNLIKVIRLHILPSVKDTRMRDSLLFVLNNINVFSTQLKIISAVKAFDPRDMDANGQLIVAASNTLYNTRSLVSYLESAALTLSDKNIPYRWRKRVYLGQ